MRDHSLATPTIYVLQSLANLARRGRQLLRHNMLHAYRRMRDAPCTSIFSLSLSDSVRQNSQTAAYQIDTSMLQCTNHELQLSMRFEVANDSARSQCAACNVAHVSSLHCGDLGRHLQPLSSRPCTVAMVFSSSTYLDDRQQLRHESCMLLYTSPYAASTFNHRSLICS